MTTTLENLGRVNEGSRGYQELFKRGDEYIVVSTTNLDGITNPTNRAIVGLAGAFGGMAVSGEETMAFRSNEKGEIADWGEIAVANGEGSRNDVLEQLADV